jgi:methyl-accepting chemotaxis protein
MMPKLPQSLQSKVIAIVLTLVALSLGALAALAYTSSNSIFLHQTTASMQSILAFRANDLQDHIHQFRDQATSLAKIETLQQSMSNLKSGWTTLNKTPGNAQKDLLKYFVTGNPNPADKRELLVKPEGPSGYYFSAHEAMQPVAKDLLASSPFRDLLMVDNKGNVIYSYKKGDAFTQNLTDPNWAKTSLGKTYAKVVASVKAATTDDVPASFSGLKVNPATGAAEVYFAVPIVNLGSQRGTIIFQGGDRSIADTLSMAIAAGSSEQANIITPDGAIIGVDPAQKRLVARDPAAFGFATDATKTLEMSVADFVRIDGAARSFAVPLKLEGESYAISESLLSAELGAGSMRIAELLAALGVFVLIAISVVTGYLLKKMFAPLGRLAIATSAVAAGNLQTAIESQSRKDEIGTMSRALSGFRDSLVAQKVMEEQSRAAELQAAEMRRVNLEEREREASSLQAVVRALGEGLDRMASGDLGCEIGSSFPGALDGLRTNFNSAARQLADALAAISRNSNAMRAGSEEMRTSADQLATRTERQSASLSEAASAIDAINQAVRLQMARAEQASKIASDATTGTRNSAEIMEKTIRAMEAIQGSSNQINSIISVIDEIAFQTNLLALNAGVEAARAGDSGKGFAVVAQEVRELAQRSAKAAKEIDSLLSKSTGEVEVGVSLVERAGQALKSIESHVTEIAQQINAMMESTREEVATLRDINASVSQLESMTQQNAAMVEETTASIHQLAQEAGEMDGRIGQFRFGEETATHNQYASDFRRAG